MLSEGIMRFFLHTKEKAKETNGADEEETIGLRASVDRDRLSGRIAESRG